MRLLAYHNDPTIKAKYVARFAAHRAADEVTQGIGYKNGRGCFVGCTLNKYKHDAFPVEIGFPEWLARLADVIFENLPKRDAAQFGADLLDSTKPGVDLEKVKYAVALGCHRRALIRLADNNESYAIQCRAAIQGVIDWIEAGAQLDKVAESARSAAEESARSAAASAQSEAASAWSAAASAESAAQSEAASARSVTQSAAWSVWSAAWSVWLSAQSAAASAASSGQSSAWSSAQSEAASAQSARSLESETQAQRDDLLTAIRTLIPVEVA